MCAGVIDGFFFFFSIRFVNLCISSYVERYVVWKFGDMLYLGGRGCLDRDIGNLDRWNIYFVGKKF